MARTRDTNSASSSEDNDIRNNTNTFRPNIQDNDDKCDDNISVETLKIIPVVEEIFDLRKKTLVHETKIVKRMATRTEKIEVPIAYEEVYVNNKKLRVYDKEEEGLLSKIKDTIAHSVSNSDDDDIEYHYLPSSSSESSNDKSRPTPSQEYYNSEYDTKREEVVLIDEQKKNETEKIVPIWGEEIIVQKRRVKLGEIVVRKRRIIESKKIDIDIKKEKVLVEYPDGRKEELKAAPQEIDIK
jgi:stress response protein YsnF